MKKTIRCLVSVLLIGLLAGTPVLAGPISDVQKEKDKAESNLNGVKKNIDNLQQNKDAVKSEITRLDSSLVDLIVTIDVLETDLNHKEAEIARAQADYDEALTREQKQYEDMKVRIKYMYERGNSADIEKLLEAESITDLLNKADFVKSIYEYDRNMLSDFQETKEEVANLKSELEGEKSEMEVMQSEFEDQKKNLEATINEKRNTVADFDSQLADAREKAKVYQKSIQEQTEKIRRLEEEEKKQQEAKKEADRKKAEAEAGKKAQSSGNTGTADSGSKNPPSANKTDPQKDIPSGGGGSNNSGIGSQIAGYGLNFVGNPYVLGGTSLTNGADCSGFTQSVFAHFGISIPRTSGAQAGSGTSVPYSEIQPGDIICYAGHVAIYIGSGQIVHASSPATGIKTGNASYRTILSVRRYY